MIKTSQITRGYWCARSLLLERSLLCRSHKCLSSSMDLPEQPKGERPMLPPTPDEGAVGVWETTSSTLAQGTTADVDVDAVSRVLRDRFSSPASVVRALEERCCTSIISEQLISKMLRRFSNDWISAFGFFNWVDSRPNNSHSQDSYNTMVDILGKARRFDIMFRLVDEMVQLDQQLITLTTVSKVVRRLAGARRWNETIDVFHNMERFGVKRDTTTMNLVLDTLCKEHAVTLARNLLLETRDEIPPNANSFNALIHGWCKVRKFDEARWTMEEMRRFGFKPCTISYTSLVEAHCVDGNFREVDRIMEEMEANGCPPNVVTYTTVMSSLAKAKDTCEDALMVWEKMKRSGCKPDALWYNSLIHVLASCGRWKDACEVYEVEMKRNGVCPTVVTYNTMIAAACRFFDEERVVVLLHEMEESSCAPDVATFMPLLKMKCRKESMDELRYLLDYMMERDVSLDVGIYSLLVNRLCRSGCLVQACYFFEDMVRKGFLPRKANYVMLLKELEKKRMEKEKEKIRKLMAEAHGMANLSCQVPGD